MPTATTQTRTAPTRPTPRRAARAALARCLEPVDAETFLAEHWERQPLSIARSQPGRFDDLLSEADVERLVCSTAIRYPGLRLVREGAQIPLSAYTREVSWRPPFGHVADAPRVLAEWEAGATIVLQALHVSWHPLAVFCRLLESALGLPVQCNAYFTPRGSQGFAVHHDTHDVLVLQLAGEKRWRVHEPVLELPLKHQRSPRGLEPAGEPYDDLVLTAGDTLYLPRGWLHDAETSETDSLHLTIGITASTGADTVRGALAASEGDLALRRSADPETAASLVGALEAELAPERVEARKRRRFVDSRRPIREDGLTQLRALARLDAETLLERRETVIADLELRDGAVLLRFEGKEILLPGHAEPEVVACDESEEPFRVGELPGELDEAGRLVLVRRLVREGLLRIVG
jgi:ribosomal protein L16 Arg81 hydroxylase